MAPKAPKVKKEKKPLTEEERTAKEEHDALVHEEHRKKKIRERRAAIKQAMIAEEKRSKLSMLQMHKTWRNIMREQSVQELRRDIQWLAKKHAHEVEIKDHMICTYCKQLEESEEQHQEAMSRHFIMMDSMIAIHDGRKQQMEENFQVQLDTLNESFFSERDNMTQKHDGLKKDIAKMIEIMKEYFDDELNVKRQAHELVLEDLKNQSKEEYNILTIQGEQNIEKTKKHLDETHQEFIERSKPKEEEFLALQKKDMATTRTIEKRLQMLIQIHVQIHYTRSMLITKGKEWKSANKSISNEKLELLTHFIKLKRSLGKATNMSHEDLKRTSTSVYQASEALKKVLTFVRKLQSLAGLNQKLETEHEMIFPFNPLYVASVPTAHLESLEKELAQENKCDIHGSPPKEKWEQLADDVVRGEPVSGEVVPKEEKRFQVDMKISYPIDKPVILNPPPKPPSYHWASFAVDDNGLEIAELDYLQNFQKRYNKVMLDKMALQLERRQLLAENEKLQTGMGKWLDGYMLTEKAKAKPNSMVGVNRCKLKPPPRKPPVIVDIPKRRPPPTEED